MHHTKKKCWNSVNANLRMGFEMECDWRMWWEAGCKRLFVRFYRGLTCWCWFLPHFLGGFPPYFLGFLPFFRIKNVMRFRQEIVCEILRKADLLMLVSPWFFWISSWFFLFRLIYFLFSFATDFFIENVMRDCLWDSAAWADLLLLPLALHGRPAYFLDN